MEKLKTLLIANRGEIAVRITRTAKSLGIKVVSIYSKADAASEHVTVADEAVLLNGSDTTAYTDGDAIIAIAKQHSADAIIPGYGFLSENASFARKVIDAGLVWVGPSPQAIADFGIKHVARQFAKKTGVPIVPGTDGLLADEDAAVRAADGLGYPVMLKATGGGGGIGLMTCDHAAEVRKSFQTCTSRAQSLFTEPGVYLEKYYPLSRHVEIQVFGNGQGDAMHFGERECSIQRRHQKVIEECPSPFVSLRPGMRDALGDSAVKLAQSIQYGSVGTVEFLVDDKTGDAFFLEMNTRLQVEHGITEMCYGIDLVGLMLKQADQQLQGKEGVEKTFVDDLRRAHPAPRGCAIEARVYAENPARAFAPSPGLLQRVNWATASNARIDTWVASGSNISPSYDPLLAKVMYHDPTGRAGAVKGLSDVLKASTICGPPTNLDFLTTILETAMFTEGKTLTNVVESFQYKPMAIDVISGGAYTLVQDYPGRPSIGKGIPHSGVMDPIASQIANLLVGNPTTTEGLEITLSGPELRFFGSAIVSLCGATMDAKLDNEDFPMWTQVHIRAGQRLKIGKTTGGGCRSYLAVFGGFPSVAEYFGSKATSPLVGIGGYQGRALAAGDLLSVTQDVPKDMKPGMALPKHLRPVYGDSYEILAMVGPHDKGYLLPEDIEMIYNTSWKVSHNASRSGIRLVGPVPKWARKDGGQGGSHPSNLVEYGYPMAALNWTGDDPCIFPVDCPNFGGFLTSTTIVKADWSKMGQLKAGDTMRYRRISFDDSLIAQRMVDDFIDQVKENTKTGNFESMQALETTSAAKSNDFGTALLDEVPATGIQPQTRYRQGGDSHIIVEYGNEEFDLNHRCRVTALEKALKDKSTTSDSIRSGIVTTVGCCTSLNLAFEPLQLRRSTLLAHLKTLESRIGDLSTSKIPTRTFNLPISFESQEQADATTRYMQTQRPHAPYLPDNLAFVAANNAFTPAKLIANLLTGTFAAVVVGFYSGNTVSLPVDPRMRMAAPKTNPSRVHTPAGTVGWGGACCSIYPVASPGGYQMLGRTLPIFDAFGQRPGFASADGPAPTPWLFRDFDLLRFHRVSEPQLDALLERFDSRRYVFEHEDTTFDMGAHNALLRETADEVARIRGEQATAQEEMVRREAESLERWRGERESMKMAPDAVEALLAREGVAGVEAPMDANVWKIVVKAGNEVGEGAELVVLEAMKLEVAVRYHASAANEAKVLVEKVLAKQGETVKAGEKLVLVRSL